MECYRDKHCDKCFYYTKLFSVWYCRYIFAVGKPRPCPPGKDCTVKVPMKVMRRKKKETADRCVCCGEIIPEGRQVCPNCERSVTNG